MLNSTQKDEMYSVNYAKMRGFADEMSAWRKCLDDDDLISFTMSGLDAEYNPIVESILSHTDSVPLGDFYAQFLAAEARLDL